ncbi:hypothetical protein [Vibrio quintilis]|uniref:Elongation factor Tu n=1 Tax=Vibrio quintilis TaxID=1117707 RepID=A0A1M7YZB6_9VIBR|nr:hypothetical protein [Vibrio quintilis]SHO57934.1 Elongation factor Tu [Vibrio quintilis]
MMNCIQSTVCFLPAPEGGRASLPVGTGYAPHIVIPEEGRYLAVRFIDIPQDIQPGQAFSVTLQLMYPDVDYSALKKGVLFEIREGRRAVGTGVVDVTGASLDDSCI